MFVFRFPLRPLPPGPRRIIYSVNPYQNAPWLGCPLPLPRKKDGWEPPGVPNPTASLAKGCHSESPWQGQKATKPGGTLGEWAMGIAQERGDRRISVRDHEQGGLAGFHRAPEYFLVVAHRLRSRCQKNPSSMCSLRSEFPCASRVVFAELSSARTEQRKVERGER